MSTYYYVYPFGQNADDLTAIPTSAAGDGSVSYFAGWTDPYEQNLLTNPSALPIPRGQMNQLFYDITNNVQQYQQYGAPAWVSAAQNLGTPLPYPIYATVYYSGVLYRNMVAANTATPGTDATWLALNPVPYVVDTSGAANTITVPLVPAPAAYYAGMQIQVKVNNTNTGATVVNVATLGNKNVTYTTGAPLVGGEMPQNGIAVLEYDGTQFQLLNPVLPNIISSQVLQASSVAMTTVTAVDITSITLTQGKWAIFGNAFFNSTGGSAISLAAWCNTVSITPPDASKQALISVPMPANLNSNGINTPFLKVTVASGTQNVYLTVEGDFPNPGSFTACGGIFALKIG